MHHRRDTCPARLSICDRCKRRGHWSIVCRSRNIQAVCEESSFQESAEDTAFLGMVDASQGDKPWEVLIPLGKSKVTFKMDTGADVTVLPHNMYSESEMGPLTSTKLKLYGPSRQELDVKGKFTHQIAVENKCCSQDIYVVKGLQQPLLGRPAIRSLELLKDVNTLTAQDIKSKFSTLFSGLGKMEGEYKIQLSADAKPFALSTPRRVPLPLLPAVMEELTHLQKLGVISPVDEATDWCAGMVVVPKHNEQIRICVDLTKLNSAVKRERLIMPSVQHTLSKLSGAKVFSKIDANSGYYQIPLSAESRLLTTFITPFGRFCFNRLPFEISSAPEHYQRRMTDVFK